MSVYDMSVLMEARARARAFNSLAMQFKSWYEEQKSMSSNALVAVALMVVITTLILKAFVGPLLAGMMGEDILITNTGKEEGQRKLDSKGSRKKHKMKNTLSHIQEDYENNEKPENTYMNGDATMLMTDQSTIANAVEIQDEYNENDKHNVQMQFNVTWLDSAGAPPPSRVLLGECFNFLSTTLISNPHSFPAMSSMVTNNLLSSKAIDDVRRRVLDLFDAPYSEYEVIFTSGCTESMHIISDCLPWKKCIKSFTYCRDAHTSMLGIREAAMNNEIPVNVVMEQGFREVPNIDGKDNRNLKWNIDEVFSTQGEKLAKTSENIVGRRFGRTKYTVVAMTLECNLTGRRRSEEIIKKIKNKSSGLPHEDGSGDSVLVILDAARAAATGPVSLNRTSADFMCVSFYKMFGYPTGVGALIVSKRGIQLLEEGQREGKASYFGGGTVDGVASISNFVVRKEGPAAFEHGTPNFQAILCIPLVIEHLNLYGGLVGIQNQTAALATHLTESLTRLRHASGRKAIELYGPCATNPEQCFQRGFQGPTVSFNILAYNGTYVGFRTVVEVASLNGIILRGGCHCNAGACELYLNINNQQKYKRGYNCGGVHDILDGKPVGCIRASLGYHSTIDDINNLLDMISAQFINSKSVANIPPTVKGEGRSASLNNARKSGRISHIFIYPMKSCNGIEVDRWPLASNGKFLYDREWALVNDEGIVLTQKSNPQLATISALPDLERNDLRITSSRYPEEELVIPLNSSANDKYELSVKIIGKINQCTYHDFSHSSHISWLEKVVGSRCRLVRSIASSTLANNSELLLLNSSSVETLRHRLQTFGSAESIKMAEHLNFLQFRPNIVISGVGAHEEDNWQSADIREDVEGSPSIQLFSEGPCARCTMINVSTDGSKRTSEPLRTLAEYRLFNGRIQFGRLMRPTVDRQGSERWLETGMSFTASTFNSK